MKIINKLFYPLMLICIVLLFFSMQNYCFAEEENNTISVSPLDPLTNEPQSSYYEFEVVPSEVKQFAIRVFNSSNRDKEVKIELNDATTNDNGITSYLSNKERDESLKIGFSDIASTETSLVSVPANGSSDIAITINTPTEKFDGVILGGVRITEATSESKKSDTGVIGKVAYTVGVVLNESGEYIEPEVKLNEVSIEQRNYRNYISANIQNIKPTIIKSMEVRADIYTKDNQKVYSAERDGMRMAPNSNFNFGISLEDKKIVAGKYLMKLSGEADGIHFSFEREFEILESDANKYNKSSLFVKDIETDHQWWYIAIAICVASCLAVLQVIRLKKRNL
ncbi:DUF916 and DUF3324 domain-containing protein [Enterococcus gallinarum]|uniref:DUF916 and DUF3324 domain-containing protein n=1 Tax=Enterococcus gallinarum TaxID=1353 RepID=UPI0012E239F7|nr:DUF916 and DUF3324 domain-containing protein [Enterococcus gallinarum]MUN90463.1 DUF3324 domain-containing protein [Enterococcus gallinarum]